VTASITSTSQLLPILGGGGAFTHISTVWSVITHKEEGMRTGMAIVYGNLWRSYSAHSSGGFMKLNPSYIKVRGLINISVYWNI
jgi:hypothetical protein